MSCAYDRGVAASALTGRCGADAVLRFQLGVVRKRAAMAAPDARSDNAERTTDDLTTMNESIERLELKLAFLERANQELSDVVYRQQQELEELRTRVALLETRVDAMKAGETAVHARAGAAASLLIAPTQRLVLHLPQRVVRTIATGPPPSRFLRPASHTACDPLLRF